MSSALERPLGITVFPNLAAMSCVELTISLREFCSYLRKPAAAEIKTKHGLPLFSMCRFGDWRSPKGSLRHRANIIGVDAVVLDHDDGTLSIADAVAVFIQAEVPAVVVATPRYTPEIPKWRAIVPLSETCSSDCYAALVGRAVGLFPQTVQFDRKSWEPSQSYFFGVLSGQVFELRCA